MANEVRIKVSSSSDPSGFKEANKSLGETKVAAEIAERQLDKVDDSLDKVKVSAYQAGQTVDYLSGNFTEADRAAGGASRRISDVREQLVRADLAIATSTASLRMLASALNDTDDAAQRLDIQKAMRKVESDLRSSKNSKKILAAMLPDDPEIPAGFITGLTKKLGVVGTPLVAVLVGAAVAAAPVMGAAIAGAVTGGAVGTGIVGGAILAARDPRIKDAGLQLGNTLLNSLTARANVFVEPVRSAIEQIQKDFDGVLAPDIGRLFANSAKFLEPLVKSIDYTIGRIVNSLADLSEVGGPTMRVLGDGIARVGDAVADMFESFEDNGVDAAMGLKMVFDLLEGSIRAVGVVINGLTESFGFLAKAGAFGSKIQQEYIAMETSARLADAANKDLADTMTYTGDAGQIMTDVMDNAISELVKLPDIITPVTKAFEASTRVIEGETEALSELSAALREQTDPTFALLRAQTKLADAQKDVNEALDRHGRASPEYQEALRKSAEAALSLEDAAGKVAATSDGQMTPALRATLEAAGLTEGQIQDLARQFQDARSKGERFAKDYRASVGIDGFRDANGRLNGLLRDLERFDGNWSANLITNYMTFGKPGSGGGLAHGGIKGAASGMVGDGMTWVGEAGPELVQLPPGANVRSAGDSQRMARDIAPGGKPSTIIVQLIADGRVLAETIVEPLREDVRTLGGGSAQQYFGVAGVS